MLGTIERSPVFLFYFPTSNRVRKSGSFKIHTQALHIIKNALLQSRISLGFAAVFTPLQRHLPLLLLTRIRLLKLPTIRPPNPPVPWRMRTSREQNENCQNVAPNKRIISDKTELNQ